MWRFVDGQVSPVCIKMEDTLAEYQSNLLQEKNEVAMRKPAGKKQWKTKQGTFQLKHQPAVHDDPMDGTQPKLDDGTFSEMLRDV